MEMWTIILLVLLGILVLWIILTFNSLVSLRNSVKNSFSGIDVQLKRRTDLIPNLINTVKGYAKHERNTLDSVTQARTSLMNASKNGNVKEMARGENMLSDALKSLFAVSENYPDLKANQNFLKLQEELSETEDQIAASRRIYNENVMYFNNKIEMFPSNVIANTFSFKKQDFFETTPEDRKNTTVKF